jgi:hypothetical protein
MLLLTVEYAKTRCTSEVFSKMPTIQRYGASISLALYHDSPSLSLSPTQLVSLYSCLRVWPGSTSMAISASHVLIAFKPVMLPLRFHMSWLGTVPTEPPRIVTSSGVMFAENDRTRRLLIMPTVGNVYKGKLEDG